MEILGSRNERIGGVRIDQILGTVLYQKCVEAFGEDIQRTDRVNFKLQAAAEKVKKEFSAEKADDISFVVQSIFEGEDYDGSVTKEEFEAACRNGDNFFDQFYHFVVKSLQDICGDRAIDAVETVGSTLRLPQLRDELAKAVEHCGFTVDKIGSSLNAEESCARGCALFAQLYCVEHTIACGEETVCLREGEDEVMSMTVCGCSPVETDGQKFVIQCNEPLQEGEDHDWKSIIAGGREFMKTFVENCKELNQRQSHRNTLEQHCSELRAILENTETVTSDLRDSIVSDRLLLESNTDLICSVALQPTTVYNDAITRISDRLEFYRTSLSINPNRLRVGDVEYVGVWMNGRMTGKFDCFDRKGVLLYSAMFRDGVLDGKMTHYYESKKLKSVQHYKEGKLDGPFVGYYENGQLAESCTFKEEKKEGYWQVYHSNGQIAKEGLIKEGKNVFINLYHRNGVIAYQHLFTEKGRLHTSYEFNHHGELVYWGKMEDGMYSGESLVFYRHEAYAVCSFVNDVIMTKKDFVSKKALRWSELDKQMETNGKLDTSRIKWKPILKESRDLANSREVTLSYMDQNRVVSLMEYTTQFDIVLKEKDGKVPSADGSRYMTPAEIQKQSMYDSNIQEMVVKNYTLFGDLKSLTEYTASPYSHVRCVQYYPTGRNEVLLNNPAMCRVRAEGEMKNKKAEGHWKEYYNNGKVRCEGEKKNGEWVEKKMYLNTGKPVESFV